MLFSKAENKFATLQCAAQALFHFLFFASEQHNAPTLKDTFFFFSFFREGYRRQDGNGIKTQECCEVYLAQLSIFNLFCACSLWEE